MECDDDCVGSYVAVSVGQEELVKKLARRRPFFVNLTCYFLYRTHRLQRFFGIADQACARGVFGTPGTNAACSGHPFTSDRPISRISRKGGFPVTPIPTQKTVLEGLTLDWTSHLQSGTR